MHGKLILLAAPAGYGKTTAAALWLSDVRHPFGWVSLSEEDDDPAVFWPLVVHALSTPPAGGGQENAAILDAATLGAFGSADATAVRRAVIRLLNGVSEREGEELVLVLDDYHIINEPSIHRDVGFLIEHVPGNLCVVLCSREDPPLPLPRLRARGDVLDLGADELTFTEEEAECFFRNAGKEETASGLAGALAPQGMGWPALLQMALLAESAGGSKTSRRAREGLAREAALEFLASEVLDAVPEALRTFLESTSILGRFCPDLCAAVTGDQAARTRIRETRSRNLFVFPIDRAGPWYRYHPLFRQLLRRRLAERGAERAQELHARACTWFEAHDMLTDATYHALEGGDYERATRLVERAADSLLLGGHVHTLRRWLGALPKEYARSNALLCVYRVLVELFSDAEPSVPRSWLQHADRADHRGRFAAEREFIRSVLGLAEPKEDRRLRFCAEEIPEERRFLQRYAAYADSGHRLMVGDLAGVERALHPFVREGRRLGSDVMAVLAACRLAEARVFEGRLVEADAHYRRALDLATNADGTIRPIGGEACLGLGWILYERDQPNEAEGRLLEGIDLIERILSAKAILGHLLLAQIRLANGAVADAYAAMLGAREIAAGSSHQELLDSIVGRHEIMFELRQGHIETAAELAVARGVYGTVSPTDVDDQLRSSPFPLFRALELVAGAHVALGRRHAHAALAVLTQLSAMASSRRWTYVVVRCRIAEALGHLRLGQREEALWCMERAAIASGPDSFVSAFLEGGREAFELLHRVSGDFPLAETVRTIVNHFRRSPSIGLRSTATGRGLQAAEVLTRREGEVAALLAGGCTDKGIAVELGISVETVRKHVKNIYGKLAVHSRSELAALARGSDTDATGPQVGDSTRLH